MVFEISFVNTHSRCRCIRSDRWSRPFLSAKRRRALLRSDRSSRSQPLPKCLVRRDLCFLANKYCWPLRRRHWLAALRRFWAERCRRTLGLFSELWAESGSSCVGRSFPMLLFCSFRSFLSGCLRRTWRSELRRSLFSPEPRNWMKKRKFNSYFISETQIKLNSSSQI